MSQQLFASETGDERHPQRAAHHAALVVHAMSESDRHWVLAQLPPAQRTALQGLLAELRDLGIPADPELLRNVVGNAKPAPSEPAWVDHAATQAHAPIRHASPVALVMLLAAEPPELVARLLAMQDWPWEQAVLEKLGDEQRRAIQARRSHGGRRAADAGANVGSAPKGSLVEQHLLALLTARLAAIPHTEDVLADRQEARGLAWLPRLRRRLVAPSARESNA